MFMMAHRAYQDYKAKYYQNTQQNYSGESLHIILPPYLAVNNYSYEKQYNCQQDCKKFQYSRRFESKVSNKNTDYKQFKDIKKSFSNIFLLFLSKSHNIHHCQLYHNNDTVSSGMIYGGR